jgi:hypothetical protein
MPSTVKTKTHTTKQGWYSSGVCGAEAGCQMLSIEVAAEHTLKHSCHAGAHLPLSLTCASYTAPPVSQAQPYGHNFA